jgi:hypothetical protein
MKVALTKDGFNALTEADPENLIFSSEYGTLKYEAKGNIDLTLPTSDFGAEIAFNHNLGYVPFVEVYMENPVGDYEYCPVNGSGATVLWSATFRITTTQVIFSVESTGFMSDIDFTFLFFIFKNDTGLI